VFANHGPSYLRTIASRTCSARISFPILTDVLITMVHFSSLRFEHNKKVLYSFFGERFKNKIKLDFSDPFLTKDSIHVFGFGSINGTFCLHEYQEGDYEKIVLWKPATQTFNLLPPSQIESAIPDEAKGFLEVLFYSRLHGFGYDHVINDYKVIRDIQVLIQPSYQYFGDLEENWLKEINSWEIYSLRSNSWRKLHVELPSSWECIEGTRVYMDGVCHWLCTKDDHVGPCLVSFHLSNEVFFVTPYFYLSDKSCNYNK